QKPQVSRTALFCVALRGRGVRPELQETAKADPVRREKSSGLGRDDSFYELKSTAKGCATKITLPIPSRHRSLALFAAALAAQILLLALQIRRGQQVRLIRVWAIESVSPLGRGAAWSVDGVRGLWNNYVALRHLREQDDQLRTEMAGLRMRNAQLESRAAEADRLAGLLGFRDAHAEVQMLAARVIGATPDPSSHMVLIDRGSRDGLRRDMGVITPEGVAGKVFAVYPDTSQVLLLTDKESGVGALLGDSRAQGPVRGTGEPLLGLEYISNEIRVEPGEKILTSGQDRIFPKDLPVGTVAQ